MPWHEKSRRVSGSHSGSLYGAASPLRGIRAEWTEAEREQLARGYIRGDFAGPNRTFPIASPADVADAWQRAEQAAQPDAVRQRIAQIARAYGWERGLPDAARSGEADRRGRAGGLLDAYRRSF